MEFDIELTALAVVKQRMVVSAPNRIEARILAKRDYDNGVWKYDGVQDNTVQIITVTERK